MSKPRATEELLGNLHEVVAKDLLRRIQSGEANPAELNAAIKFLQNNGIEALPVEGSPLAGILSSLPTFDDDELTH
ncbi:hypothetical protein UFOVP63_41 [uncultured Caudovirales phage]|uniref:Uncharacterized protein n=1 Tax=uncultured Caudovirales phage TaxID=2100421 RepID=A0A6J5KR13_9CAUD|nr:hypothetical protein UFOVP63_41 [uncultured Caudovirales phage]